MISFQKSVLLAALAAPVFGAVPLTFEPNRGQADANVAYVARGAGYYLTLNGTGPRMVLRRGGKSAEIRTALENANPDVALTGNKLLAGHSAYFHGNDARKWITGLPNYGQVKAAGVYPGIDLIYYGNQSSLEYDFVVAPGADPKRIRMRFDGVTRLRKAENGDLVLQTAAGDLVQHKPVVYQTIAGVRKPVDGAFLLHGGNTAGFALGSYDPSQPVTIDPVLVYSTFLGGTDTDEGHVIATDGAANTYMTGVTFSTRSGDADVLVRKISADGTTFLYTADLGGSGNDYGNGLAVDVNGYAFIGGRTTSTDFPAVNAFQNQNYGANNAFVLRLDPAGSSFIFSTYVGGSNDDRGYAVAVDQQGSVYLTGAATSNDFPTSNGAFQTSRQGGADAFVIKFSYNGGAIYSTFLGGGSDDYANGIAVDRFGNAYVAGDTNSDSFPVANAPFQRSRHGGLEGFVTEVNGDGSGLVFSTFIGGNGDDSCGGVALDLNGNIYVAGSTTTDSGFNTPGRSYNTTYNGGASDIFVAKYTPGGQSLAWTVFLGSHGGDYGNAITTDANGNVYVAGDTDSSEYPVTRDAIQGNRAGRVDAVLSVLDTNGQNLVYSTFFGGSSDDSALSVAVDQYAEVYLTGSTVSNDLPITNGAVQPSAGGGSDAFLAKFSVYGSAIPGSAASANPAPVTAYNPPSSTVSVFGRGLVVPAEPGTFSRATSPAVMGNRTAGVRTDQFQRLSRPGRPVINR